MKFSFIRKKSRQVRGIQNSSNFKNLLTMLLNRKYFQEMVLKALKLVLRTVVLEIARATRNSVADQLTKNYSVLFKSELLDLFQEDLHNCSEVAND